MALKYAHYSDTDPDWEASRGYYLKAPPYPPVTIDLHSDREAQKISEGEWETQHPLNDIGYSSRSTRITMRDGEDIWMKVCRSTRLPSTTTKLPLIFVTHGGGWVQGTPITEEAWLLWPLLQFFDLVTISIDYRLAPESIFPTYSTTPTAGTLSKTSFPAPTNSTSTLHKSSSPAPAQEAVSHSPLPNKSRDANIPIKGVLANPTPTLGLGMISHTRP